MASKALKTTAKDFKLFKVECLKWIEVFGLKAWDFYFQHGGVGVGNIAYCERNCNSRVARLSFCKKWPEGSIIEFSARN